MSVTGGQATSMFLDKEKYDAEWPNDGVQGRSTNFRYTLRFLKQYGYEQQEVRLQVAFGKGKIGF
jgi:hypothetical protein